MLFRVEYSDRAPSGDVIGRGNYIEADCLEDAEALAWSQRRLGEELKSVRRFVRGEVS
jgi:hypothetical protein